MTIALLETALHRIPVCVSVLAAERDARFRYFLDDPLGFMRTENLAGLAGAASGGLVGAQINGERPGEIMSGALFGAVLGWYGGAGLARGAQALRQFLVGREYRQTRTKLSRPAAVVLIILGSGIAAMGAVDSRGMTAGLGVMLIVGGGFLGGWGRTLTR